MAKKNGWLTGDSLAGTTSRLLVIPGDMTMVMAVTGALYPLTEQINWEKFGTVEPEDAAYAMRLMLLDYLQSDEPEPGMDTSMIIFPDQLQIASGQPWTWTSDTASSLAGYFQQTPPTITDASYTTRWFSAGVWEYRIVYFRNTDAGAAEFEIAPVSGGAAILNTTLSWYGAAQRNSVFSGTFIVPASGNYGINLLGIFPNPSSTGNLRRTQRIQFWRRPDL